MKKKDGVKIIDLAKEGFLLPPRSGVCQECATDHTKDQPHNGESLHYKYYFYGKNGKFPNWLDAMAHCSESIQDFWKKELKEKGVDLEIR